VIKAKLYNVSIINRHDIWLKDDEENPLNWVVMSKEQLEQYLKRKVKNQERGAGRAIIDYADIVWRSFA